MPNFYPAGKAPLGIPTGGAAGVMPPPSASGPPLPATLSTGAGPASGKQTPSIAGTGTFTAQPYPINMGAITDSSQTADIWNRLQGSLGNLQPQSYQTQAAQLGAAPQFRAAQGAGATGTAAAGSPAWWQAAMGQAPMGYAAQGGYALGGPTGISTAGDLAWQAQQQQLANVLGNQAAGYGVSPADIQLQRGLEQGIGEQLSVLGSQRGNMGNAALTARAAADQGSAAQANFNSQMGMQRAQETLAAQQALGNVLGTARGQAQNYNINQANLVQQMSLADLANAQASQMQNTGFRQQMGLANLSDVQAMQLANLGYRNQALQGSAQLGQGMNLANLQAANQFGLSNLGNAQQTMLANLANVQQQNLANQALMGQYGLTQGQFNQQTALANQQAAYQGMGQYYNQLNALLGAGAGVAESNRAAQLSAQQLAVQQQIAQNQVNAQAYAASAGQNANLFGAGVNAAGGFLSQLVHSLGGTVDSTSGSGNTTSITFTGSDGQQYIADANGITPVSSDERHKTDIRSAGDTVHALLSAVSDENLKTGIMGGNPMLQSYLEQYRAASAKQANVDPTVGENFRLTQTPRGVVGGSAGSSLGRSIGSSAGGALGTAGGAAAGTAIFPGVGTIIGGVLGGLLGSEAGGAAGGSLDSSGTPGTGVGGQIQASGIYGNANLSDAPDYSQLAAIGKGDVDETSASSDDREKEAIMGGNRGIQAFLQQQNAQQQAGANQGGMSNTFMQTGTPPTAQLDRQMPYNPNMGYGAPQWMGLPMGGGYNTDAGLYGMGGIYGGGYGVGGMTQGTTLSPGGVSAMGGLASGGTGGAGAPFMQNPTFNNAAVGGMSPYSNTGGTDLATIPRGTTAPMAGVPTPISNATLNTSVMGGTAPALNSAIGVANPVTAPYVNAPGGNLAGPLITPATNPNAAIANPIYATNSLASRALSDEEQKVDASPENLRAMLDALQAYSYRYKDPSAPGAAPGRRIGVMAQDLERSPLGSQFVVDTPQGKMVNYGQAAGTMMAGLAYHNQRLDEHEQMLRSLLQRGTDNGGPNPY